jgi:adenosylhomocysteine nucleosidase
VKEEAGAFQRLVKGRREIRVILTGMGKRNAERSIRAALAEERPDLVLSSGFAGGLRPDWGMGMVVFAADTDTGLEPALLAAGAKPGRFHCADRVAATAAEKRALCEKGGADAVEMESESVCAVCREHGVPCATVRVILDAADEDLPLDFNRLLTAEQRMSYGKLAVTLAASPGKVRALLGLRRQTRAAADRLAEVLGSITGM